MTMSFWWSLCPEIDNQHPCSVHILINHAGIEMGPKVSARYSERKKQIAKVSFHELEIQAKFGQNDQNCQIWLEFQALVAPRRKKICAICGSSS